LIVSILSVSSKRVKSFFPGPPIAGRNELQYGENDYKVIFAAVDKAGYTGACGLEYRPLMDPEESLREVKRLYGK